MTLLSEDEARQRLTEFYGWHLVSGEGPPSIEREFKLADFSTALAFVNRVGEAAEAVNHHPDMLLHGWNEVRMTLSTHSAGGLTEADFALAARIDELS